MKKNKIWRYTGFSLLFFLLLVFIWQLSLRPTHDRDWSADQAILPWAEIENEIITIHNIRNFNYRDVDDYDIRYETRSYNLNEIKTADYMVVPFAGLGAAHTMISFGFNDGQQLAISTEIRKTPGVSFSPWRGLFRQYELMYVVADEADVIKLRTNHRREPVYLYPTKANQENIQLIFLGMIIRVNEIKIQPEFYNTITNNCTTNIAKHINQVSPGTIPWWDLRLIAPANSDVLAYKLNLLDIEANPKEIREEYLINDLALKHQTGDNFSELIRSNR